MVTERDIGKRVRYRRPSNTHAGYDYGTLREIKKGKARVEPLHGDHRHEIDTVPVAQVRVWKAAEATRLDAPTPPPPLAEPTKEHELKATSIQSAAGGTRAPQKAAPLIAGPRVVRVEEPESLHSKLKALHGRIATVQEHVRNGLLEALSIGSDLLQLRASVEHGRWTAALSETWGGSARTARRWMQVAEHRESLEPKIRSGEVSSIAAALREISPQVEEPEDDPFAPPAPAPKPEPADATTDMAGLAHELIGAVSQVQKLKSDADAAEEFAREARREADKAVARHKEAALAVQNIRQRMNDLIANVCTLEGA